MRSDDRAVDPITGEPASVHDVQPFQAVKHYTCPGCNQPITPRTGHVVVVPDGMADLRRHWHRACWANRSMRRTRG